MVATTDPYATSVGVGVLRAGGNAVDAAVAVSFALAVVNPEAGNIGGSGFLVLRTQNGDDAALDFRSQAPSGAAREMYLDSGGAVSEHAMIGALSAAVPGSVMGMWEAHRRFGRRPWEELLDPALELADGFEVKPHFLRSFTPGVVDRLRRFPGSAGIFLPAGGPPTPGTRFSQPELRRTLERIRGRGPEGFYAGETAELIVAEMRRSGGIITHEDLAAYRAVWREPVRFRYRGHSFLSVPPPSSGGVTLGETAHILERFPLGELPWHGSAHIHLLAEAWRRAFADRNHYLADPDFVPMPLETLNSSEYGAWRALDISMDAASRSSEVTPGGESYLRTAASGGSRGSPADTGHTTHYSIVDGRGNAAAVTTTLNSWYGSKLVVGEAGFLLNNEMDDFAAKPGAPNQFGLIQGEANAIAPGKRMLSAMAPTIVLDPQGRLFLVVGSPGGPTIITTVFQVISNVVDHGMALGPAVLAPRVHHQHLPDQVVHERGGLPQEVVKALERLGHSLLEREEPIGDVQAVMRLRDGTLLGQSDPRRGGAAIGL